MGKYRLSKINKINFNDGFWDDRLKIIHNIVIPYQWQALNDHIPGAKPSHAIENFRIAAGEVESKFEGRIFQDSDVAKWLEAASYGLAYESNPELEKITDKVVDLIEKAQQDDGYLNSYFIVAEPDKKWTNLRDCHEMYCAGHLIEAAVAYYQATGKDKLLNVACNLADHIDDRFGAKEGKIKGYPGHQEIELALVKLYRVTDEERYLKLSKFFVNERGQKPHFFELEAKKRGKEDKKYFEDKFLYKYNQSHLPIRDQKVVVGHAVRAMYFYSGVTDIAIETDDKKLKKTIKDLWENVTKRQMYITGGVGSQLYGEAFSFDYDLPNDTAYTETCAAIGLVFWAQRMLQLELKNEYGDVMEKALYNGVLSGISLDGTKYFYVNPLEVWPEASRHRNDQRHVKGKRQKWFGCACCPPNIARLLASIGNYIYSYSDKGIYTHLYTNSTASFNILGKEVLIKQETDYPWEGKIKISVTPTDDHAEFTLGLRVPGWCQEPELFLNGEIIDLDILNKNGYVLVNKQWEKGDTLELNLPMPVEKMAANPEVRENAGKVAIQRGPVIYCLEEVDNGKNLRDITLPVETELKAEFNEGFLGGVVTITGEALRTASSLWNNQLYKPRKKLKEKIKIKLIPYYAWANRKPGEMLTWIKEDI